MKIIQETRCAHLMWYLRFYSNSDGQQFAKRTITFDPLNINKTTTYDVVKTKVLVWYRSNHDYIDSHIIWSQLNTTGITSWYVNTSWSSRFLFNLSGCSMWFYWTFLAIFLTLSKEICLFFYRIIFSWKVLLWVVSSWTCFSAVFVPIMQPLLLH